MEGKHVSEVPDFYIDGYSVNIGPFGVTFTLMRSKIDEAGKPAGSNEVIAHVRLSKELTGHLVEGTRNLLAQSKKGTPGPVSTKSH